MAQRETKCTLCPLTWCLPSERTPLQTSQEITVLLLRDIIPHIPGSPQTRPPYPTYRNSVNANMLMPSFHHTSNIWLIKPPESISLPLFWHLSETPQFVFFIPEDLCGGYVLDGENIALQLAVSIPGSSEAHQSLCKVCGVSLLLCPDVAEDSDEIHLLCLNWPLHKPHFW